LQRAQPPAEGDRRRYGQRGRGGRLSRSPARLRPLWRPTAGRHRLAEIRVARHDHARITQGGGARGRGREGDGYLDAGRAVGEASGHGTSPPMSTITTNQFKNGNHIEVDGTVFKILEFQHVKPGKGGPLVPPR